ncbi:MAG: hypothetical protein HYX78_09735 [Armatimonadetes bacterium]|nr:hypothetical protein [Armatimonadota bacterium]
MAKTLLVEEAAMDTCSGMFGRDLKLHRAFWMRRPAERPLLGCNLGFYVRERYPATMSNIADGAVSPDDICVDLFLDDCERLYESHRELDDDYPFVASPFIYVPWMEAIMGCPVHASPSSLWAEPCVSDWSSWHWQRPTLDNPWAEKLLELMRALVEHTSGRYPVSATMMRGPADILAAMRGAPLLPLDLLDSPDTAAEAAALCAEVWVEVGKAQLELAPASDQGYMDGDRGFRIWSPEKMVWLQEDAMSLLSPELYKEFFLPIDRRIASEFSAVAFHLHGSALWAIEDLAAAPEIDVIELNFEAANADVEGAFAGCKTIQSSKPLVMWRLYDDGFWPWLDRVLAEFPPQGLSIQVTVNDLEVGKSVKAGYLKRIERLEQVKGRG